jgi:DNA-binding MarR family transcriptional regulator
MKKNSNTIDNPDTLYQIIKKNVGKNSLIYIERLDYFLNIYNFKEIITCLYKINEIIRNRDAILLLHINPKNITDEKISILNEEFYEYSIKKSDITIDKDLYDILEFIELKNKNNIIVSYKEIGLNFGISKITVSKKIDILVNMDLVETIKSGRAKILHLTDKGKDLIRIKI